MHRFQMVSVFKETFLKNFRQLGGGGVHTFCDTVCKGIGETAICVWQRGEGVQKMSNLCNIINEWSLIHYFFNLFCCRNYNSEKGVYGYNAPGWNDLKKKLNEGNQFVGAYRFIRVGHKPSLGFRKGINKSTSPWPPIGNVGPTSVPTSANSLWWRRLATPPIIFYWNRHHHHATTGEMFASVRW
jgi:hypothetical protein